MSSFRFTALAVALGLVAGACSEQPAPTAAGDATAAFINPMSVNTGGPANPGMSGVFRGQDVIFVFTTDPGRDVLAAHFQADDIFFCGGGSDFELSDFQVVNNQEDVLRTIDELRDAPIFLYQLSAFPGFGDEGCRFFAEDWLFQGTHTIRNHDNDLGVAGRGANAFGWSGQGPVYDPGGASHQYSEQQVGLILPDGTFFGFINENIRVTKKGH